MSLNHLPQWVPPVAAIDQVRRILAESPEAWLNAAQIARELERFSDDAAPPSAREVARALHALHDLGEVESRELPGRRAYWHPHIVWRRR